MKYFPKGSATIELMLALAIMATMLATAAAVSYGNFAMTMDSELYQEKLYEVSSNLEWGRAELTKDINSTVVPPSGVTIPWVSDCSRQVISTKNWTAGPRSQSITQNTIIVDPGLVRATPSCSLTPPSGSGWECPWDVGSGNISPDVTPTSIDVVQTTDGSNKRLAYVTSTDKNKTIFVIYDVTNADSSCSLPAAVASVTGPNNNTAGYYDVAAVWSADGTSAYAYAVGRDGSEELRVIDVKNSPYTDVITPYDLPDNTQNAKSVAYLERIVSGVPKKILFIGTDANGSGGELYVVDVTDLGAISIIGTPVEIGADVNAVLPTSDNYVYLATSNTSGELVALNTNDLMSVTATFIDLNPNEAGRSLYKVGNRLYFGRDDENSNDSNHDFLIFDIETRMSPAFISGSELAGDVNGLVVVGNLAFLATDESNKELKIREGILSDSVSLLSDNQLSNKATAVDYEGDRVYVLSGGGSTELQTYRPSPTTCAATPVPDCP